MMMRGKLKVFLGYAAGVGKTYQMLVEAQRLKQQGVDVVIGYFEPHARKETIAQTEGLETVPRRRVLHRGSSFQDMDAAAVIARHPQVAVVDEFAHTNVPGMENLKRWQDVEQIRAAGIDVLTSLNVQHIESLNDHVWHVTGIRVRETIPDWVLHDADEVVMVDVTPRALVHRMERGVIYAPEKAAQALENFFTEANLTALRELALRQTAHQLEEPKPAAHAARILIWLTPHPTTAMLIRRGRRVADYLGAPCTAVYLEKDAPVLEDHLTFCRNLRIEAAAVGGPDQLTAVAKYAREHGITHVYLTRHTPDLKGFVKQMPDLHLIIVAERGETATISS